MLWRTAPREAMIWQIGMARVQLADSATTPSRPTDRQYWLIMTRNAKAGEYKHRVGDAPSERKPEDRLRAAFACRHVMM